MLVFKLSRSEPPIQSRRDNMIDATKLRTRAAAAVMLAGASFSSFAQTGDPVAIVERVTASGAGVAYMDYIAAGQVIRLSTKDTLVLNYLRSCLRETISGGVVTVGMERSEVSNGEVQRERFPCDAGRLRLTPQQLERSGVIVLRGGPPPESPVEITIFARTPAIDGVSAGVLLIERLDRPADRLAINVTAAMARKRPLDLALLGVTLEPGGRYVVTTGKRQLVFAVADGSRAAGGPLLARLLRL